MLTVGYWSYLELIELEKIFVNRQDEFVRFRHRLIEHILTKVCDDLLPQPSKSYPIILENLDRINRIFVEGEKSKVMILCFQMIYFSISKSPYRAEQIQYQVKKIPATRNSKHLKFLFKVASALVSMSQGKPDDGLILLLGVIRDIDELQTKSSERLKRKYIILHFQCYYWTALFYQKKRWYAESVKYCLKGVALFEKELPEYEADHEFRVLYIEMVKIANESNYSLGKLDRIESRLTGLEAKQVAVVKPKKNTDYQDLEIVDLDEPSYSPDDLGSCWRTTTEMRESTGESTRRQIRDNTRSNQKSARLNTKITTEDPRHPNISIEEMQANYLKSRVAGLDSTKKINYDLYNVNQRLSRRLEY